MSQTDFSAHLGALMWLSAAFSSSTMDLTCEVGLALSGTRASPKHHVGVSSLLAP